MLFFSNNAGVMFCPYQLSEDGIEMQFATNHLGMSIDIPHPGFFFLLFLDYSMNQSKNTGNYVR